MVNLYYIIFEVYDNLKNVKRYGFIASNGRAVLDSEKEPKVWTYRKSAENAFKKIKFDNRYKLLKYKIEEIKGL